MSCNSCAKPFGLLRKEKGCPGCGFSYCSKCLDNKLFLPKINSKAKVCGKCKRSATSNKPNDIEPPKAYFKRLETIQTKTNIPGSSNETNNSVDDEIQKRLKKLNEEPKKSAEEEIADRLKNLKGEVPTATDAEIAERLAKLRGVPVGAVQSQPVLLVPDNRTEQEQADDLIKQYLEETQIDAKYQDELNSVIDSIETRLHKLKGQEGGTSNNVPESSGLDHEESEEKLVKKVLEKYKAEALLEAEETNTEMGSPQQLNDELPFCEICNEDASLRCLGCRYLFCKRCFMDHKDDDDGCNRYENYVAPKTSN